MRRLEFLIREVRRATSQVDTNRFDNNDMANYFNRAQRAIQKIILNSNTDTLMFADEQDYTIVNNQRAYDLPSDIFAQNAVVALMISADQANWAPLRFVTPKEYRTNYGYYVDDKELYLVPTPQSGNGYLRLHYIRKLYDIGPRFGKVSSTTVASPNLLTITGSGDNDISDYADYFSVVDKDGAFISAGLEITSYDPVTKILSTDSSITGITTDHYVIAGKRATSHSEMPEACEDLLMKHVERSLANHDSSSDVNNENIFTEDERADLIELFSQNTKDVPYPPITDTTYVGV